MKKKLLPLLLVAAILFSLAACGSPAPTPAPAAATPAPSTPTPPPTPPPAPQPTPEVNMTTQLKNVDITIVGAELSERSGVAQLRVYYDCTNTSTKILSPLYGFESERKAFQNDEELGSNIYALDNVDEYSKYATLLYPGASIRACENFELLDTTSFVTVHVGDNRAEPSLVIEFDPTALSPLKPQPELVLVPTPEDITDWLGYQGLASDFGPNFSKTEINLALLKHEVVKHEGNTYLRVYFELTTLAVADDKKVSAFMDTNYWFFQDGIQLERDSAMDTYGLPSPADIGKHGDTVLLDETNTYVVNRLLHSDSDVVVMASLFGNNATKGDPFIGTIISVK